MTTRSGDHVREHQSILMAVEKRFLVRAAHRMPTWVNSDHLTLLGMAGMLLAGLSYWAARWDERAPVGR